MLGTSPSNSKESSKEFSKDSFLKRSNRSLPVAITKDFELETKDRVLFGLCNYDDIDNYFNELCQENKTKNSTIQKIVNYTKNSELQIASPKTSFPPKKLKSFTVSSSHASLSANNPKASVAKTDSTPHSMKDLHSEVLKQRSVAFVGVAQLDEEAIELLKEFGITQAALAGLETEEQKQEYIATAMKRKLEEDYERWRKEMDKRDKDIQKHEVLYDEMTVKFEKERTDSLKWLKLKTKFPFLKKKLKLGLMEVLNNTENQKEIEKSLDEIRSKDKSMMNSTRRITLDHIPAVNNTEILVDVLGSSDAVFKAGKAYRKKLIQQKRQSSGTYNCSESSQTLHSPTSSGTGPFNLNTASLVSTSRSQAHSIIEMNSPYGLQIPTQKSARTEENVNYDQPSHYTWDYEAENDFKNHKQDARARLLHHIKSSSWNEVGLAPFVQVSHKEETQKTQRNNLLERYRKGEFLTPQEFTKIASTSQFLNSALDKNKIRDVVNQLDPDIVDAVEIDLTQKIIHNYQQNRSQVQKARMEYLNFDNFFTKKKVQENDEKHKLNLRIKYGQEEQTRLLKEMSQRYESYEKHKKDKEKPSGNTSRSILNTERSAKKVKSPESERASSKTKKKRTKNLVLDVNASKRYNHPSSKLLINTEERQKDFLGLVPNMLDPKLNKRVNEDPNQFLLPIHSDPILKNRRLFSRYYSGGPLEYQYEATNSYHSSEIPRFKGTKLEHKAATFLKAHVKGLLEREKFEVTKRHILEDRKVVRGLQNNEEGLPDVLKVVFLAITEDNTDTKFKKNSKSVKDSNKLKALALELQQKEPIIFAQFKREVMKQYYIYQIGHHGKNRETGISKNKLPDAESERKALIASLKNAMKVVKNQSQFISVVLDGEDEQANKKNENTTPGANSGIQKKTITTPLGGALMTAREGNNENGHAWGNPKSRTGTHKMTSSFADMVKNQTKEDPKAQQTNHFTSPSLETLNKDSKPRPESQKMLIKRKSMQEIRSNIEKAERKKFENSPRKISSALAFKLSKLMTSARSNNFNLIQRNGYTFSESDVNIKDNRMNTPLYYAAKAGNFLFCRYLTDLNARVNEHCENGNTPLHMAFKSDNEGVIMLLLVKGGNLNTLNDEGFTPLAFGSERMLRLLDLNSGVATYKKQGRENIQELPEEHDNNYLLNRGSWAKQQEETATMKYKAFASSKQTVRGEGTSLSQYFLPSDSYGSLSKQ